MSYIRDFIKSAGTNGSNGNFAALEGPHSLYDTFKNNWHTYFNKSTDLFEIIGEGEDSYTGIKILKKGVYRCEVVQRGKENKNYCIVSMDGDRDALENNINGIWGHDHSQDNNNWSKSLYVGELNVNDIISGGYINSDDGTFNDSGHGGMLIVTKIGDA